MGGRTPRFFDNQVFLTASYGIGAELHQLNGDTARKMWASDDAMSSQYNTPLYYRSHLYGVHGREDGLPAELRCIDAANGSVVWRKKDFGVANLLRAEETIIAVTAKGELVLVQSTPTKYIELGRTRFTEGDDNNNVRAIPAVSQARLYIRDKSELFSIQIGR